MHSTVITVESMSLTSSRFAARCGRHHGQVDRRLADRLPDAPPRARPRAPSATGTRRPRPRPASAARRRARGRPRATSAASSGARAGSAIRQTTDRGATRPAPPPRDDRPGGDRRPDRRAASRRSRSSLAQALGGVIVNADSMQLYRELPLLTARPDAGRRGARAAPPLRRARRRRAGLGRALARSSPAEAIEEAVAAGRLPIVVGGTGPLSQGAAARPRAGARGAGRGRAAPPSSALAQLGAPGCTPSSRGATRRWRRGCGRSDRQRLLRAGEVLAATGRSLADWQAEPALRGAPARSRSGASRCCRRAPRCIERIARRLQGDDRGRRARRARGAARRPPGPRICRC